VSAQSDSKTLEDSISIALFRCLGGHLGAKLAVRPLYAYNARAMRNGRIASYFQGFQREFPIAASWSKCSHSSLTTWLEGDGGFARLPSKDDTEVSIFLLPQDRPHPSPNVSHLESEMLQRRAAAGLEPEKQEPLTHAIAE